MEHVEVRRLITEDKVRPDGRRVDEIRPLDAEVDFLPNVHGSGSLPVVKRKPFLS